MTRTGLCARIRSVIAAYPGATYADISKALDVPAGDLSRDVRKMVQRGLIVCTEVAGVKYHTIGRKPLKDRTGTPAQIAARRRDSIARYEARRQAAKRAERRAAGIPARIKRDVTASARMASYSIAPPSAPAANSADYEASGGHIERLPVTWAAPDYRRKA